MDRDACVDQTAPCRRGAQQTTTATTTIGLATTTTTATIYRLGHPDVYDRYDYCYHIITTFTCQGFSLDREGGGLTEERGREEERRLA